MHGGCQLPPRPNRFGFGRLDLTSELRPQHPTARKQRAAKCRLPRSTPDKTRMAQISVSANVRVLARDSENQGKEHKTAVGSCRLQAQTIRYAAISGVSKVSSLGCFNFPWHRCFYALLSRSRNCCFNLFGLNCRGLIAWKPQCSKLKQSQIVSFARQACDFHSDQFHLCLGSKNGASKKTWPHNVADRFKPADVPGRYKSPSSLGSLLSAPFSSLALTHGGPNCKKS